MPRDSIPAYRRHKKSGQAVVTLASNGARKDVLLGKYGTKASRQEYARVIAEWEARGRALPAAADLTVAELIARHLAEAKGIYPPRTQANIREAYRPLNFLYGPSLAREFGPLALKAVRDLLIRGYDHPKYGTQPPIARTTINKRIGIIKGLFKWAVSDELVPPSLHHALTAVKGLHYGRSAARETEPVKPVPRPHVDSTLAKAPPIVADMIQLQLLTGMRPGELVILRGIDLDTSGRVWLYRPEKHKTTYRGHERIIAIGPRGQAIVKAHLQTNLESYLFSPARQEEMIGVMKRAARKTKVQPSQANRRARSRKRPPADRYTVNTYARAVKRAAERADVPHWHPNQLRHSCATDLRKEFGIDGARTVLGHRSAAITEVYAELDQAKAVEIMAKIG